MRQTFTLLLALALSSPACASTKDGIAYYNEGNYSAALAAFAAAAGQGSAEAKHMLASLYYEGHGVERDEPRQGRKAAQQHGVRQRATQVAQRDLAGGHRQQPLVAKARRDVGQAQRVEAALAVD